MLPPNASDIKVKVAYNGEIMITYIKEGVNYEQLCREIRMICRFLTDQVNDSGGKMALALVGR